MRPTHRTGTRLPLLLALLALAGCRIGQQPQEHAPAHDAYLWQRVWDGDVRRALAQAYRPGAPLRGVRVLALQRLESGHWRGSGLDPTWLRTLPVVVYVVRIEGARPGFTAEEVLDELAPLLAAAGEVGVALAGIEIDHDCATAALDDYARQIHALRLALPHPLQLGITVLPSWAGAPALDETLRQADYSVLQLHGLKPTPEGLFDARTARRWLSAFLPAARKASRPFDIALPSYGLRLIEDADARIVGVAAEAPRAEGGLRGQEWLPDPAAVAELLVELKQQAPAGWRGVVWFRLPVPADRRGWSLSTLEAAIAGRVETLLVPKVHTRGDGLVDILLRNEGGIDAVAPKEIVVRGSCAVGDGIHGYALTLRPGGAVLARRELGWLRAGAAQPVGWLRCQGRVTAEVVARPRALPGGPGP